MATLDRDLQGELQGLVFGSGTPYRPLLRRGVGWQAWDTPEIRATDRARGGRSGATSGDDLAGQVEFRPQLQIVGADWSERLDELRTAWARSDGPVWLRLRRGGQTRRLMGRPRGVSVDLSGAGHSVVVATCRFRSTSPWWFADEETVLEVTTATGDAGFGPPFGSPFGSGGQASGIVSAVNQGDQPTWPHVRIDGPASNPRLEHVDTGQVVQVGITVPEGQHLDIDFDHRTVLLSGTASRYDQLTQAGWWQLEPGPQPVRYTTSNGDGPATIRFRSAYT